LRAQPYSTSLFKSSQACREGALANPYISSPSRGKHSMECQLKDTVHLQSCKTRRTFRYKRSFYAWIHTLQRLSCTQVLDTRLNSRDGSHRRSCIDVWYLKFFYSQFGLSFVIYFFIHCFICRPSDSKTVLLRLYVTGTGSQALCNKQLG
jgi:hypothetical protein